MAFGLKTFDASGAVIFDSTTAMGGVVAGLYTYGSNQGDTLYFPAFAGLTCIALLVNSGAAASQGSTGYSDSGATVDYALGYPRVTIAGQYYPSRSYLVIVF